MVMQVEQPTNSNNPDAAQTGGNPATKQVGVIEYPDGIDASWLVSKTQHLRSEFDKWFNKELSKIEEKYKAYEVKQINGTLPGGTSIPVITSNVDTSAARLVGALLGREKYVDAIPMDPQTMLSADASKNQIVEDYTNELMKTTPYWDDKCDELIKTLLLENVGVAEVVWTEEQDEDLVVQREVDPMTGQVVVTGQQTVSSKRCHPDLLPLTIRQMLWDPRCKTRFSESPYLAKRTMVSINELLRLEKDGVIENVQAIVEKANKQIQQDNKNDPDGKQSQAVEGVQLPTAGWDDGIWALDTWWATLAWKDSKGEYQTGEYQFWIVGNDTVVKFRDNPLTPKRKPFITVKLSKKPGMLLAQGPVDTIMGMYKDIITNMSKKNSLVTNAANSPTFYEPSSGLDGRRVSLQTNSMIPVLNVNAIKRVEPPVQAIGLIDKTIEFLIAQCREATAANEQAQGIGADADTATESQILANGSNTRFQYMAEMIGASLFSDYANECFLLSKQFGTPGQMVYRQGGMDGQAVEVTPEDLQGKYVFKSIAPQSQQGKERRFMMLQKLVTDLMTAPPGAFKDSQGQVMQPQAYDFLVKQMLPLIDVSSNGLFAPVQMQPGMMGGMAPAGPGSAQAGPMDAMAQAAMPSADPAAPMTAAQ